MKFSANWLKELTGLSWSAETMSDRLADLGFPVVSIVHTGVNIPNIVSAKILSVEKHPNADKLSVTQIDDGSTKRTVVCGATNIAPGQIVPLAKPGAKFPSGLEISVAKLRGIESQGMLCSERELGLSTDHAGIMMLPADTKLGVEMSRVLENDAILDIEVPPNRPDALNHVGLARELSALSGKKSKTFPLKWKPALKGDTCKIENRDPRLCLRYLGKLIQGVKVGPSPLWMAKRLSSCGIRPINNIVDVTNYVLLEWGHPLHAFDLASLKGSQIIVRRAKEGEKIEALDGKSYNLKNEDLVIADAESPVAIAGIMGGQTSGVTNKTTDILLESAVFDPSNVRSTSKRLGLKSESSLRFEKGTHPDTALMGSMRAAQLILEVAGGHAGRMHDSYPKKAGPVRVNLSLARMERLIGAEIKAPQVERIVSGLGYGLKKVKKEWALTRPFYRLDVNDEADVIEDVLRVFGYNKIPASQKAFRVGEIPTSFQFHDDKDIADLLMGWGFQEVLTSSMVSVPSSENFGIEENQLVELSNPMSQEETVLRPLLLLNLLTAVQRNIHHKRESVALFEMGTRHFLSKANGHPVEEKALAFVCYGDPMPTTWNRSSKEVDFYFIKGLFEALNARLGFTLQLSGEQNEKFLHPHQKFGIHSNGSRVGWGGVLHPQAATRYDFKRTCVVGEIRIESRKNSTHQFKDFSKFPYVERDIAVIVDQTVDWSRLAEAVKEAGGPLLKTVVPFDIFSGGALDPQKKSVAFRCQLQEETRTLSESDITQVVDRIKSAVVERCGAQLR